MKKVLLYSMLLLMGLVLSQVLPSILGNIQGHVGHRHPFFNHDRFGFYYDPCGIRISHGQVQSRKIRLGLCGGLHRRLFSLDFRFPLFFVRHAAARGMV